MPQIGSKPDKNLYTKVLFAPSIYAKHQRKPHKQEIAFRAILNGLHVHLRAGPSIAQAVHEAQLAHIRSYLKDLRRDSEIDIEKI